MNLMGIEVALADLGLAKSDAESPAANVTFSLKREAGTVAFDGRFATGVIHLWHPPFDRAQLAANDARLDAVLQSDRTRAQRGLSALRTAMLAEGGAQPEKASD